MSIRADIEDAIVERLMPLASQGVTGGCATGYLRYLNAYAGELENTENLGEVEKEILGRLPAIMVTTGSSLNSTQSTQRRRVAKNLEIEVIVASGIPRKRINRTRGEVGATPTNGRDPGGYQMIEDVENLLIAFKPIVGASSLVPTREQLIAHTTKMCVWRLAFGCSVNREAIPKELGAEDLTELEANHNLDGADEANPIVVAVTPVTP